MDDRWLGLVRLARDCGDLSSLFPPDIEKAYDLPFTIHNAILSGLAFLSFEELPKKERPPKTIWTNGEKMKAWWDEVERIRKAEMEGHGEQSGMVTSPLRDQLLIGFEK